MSVADIAHTKWEFHSLSSIIELIGGGTPKTSIPEYWNGDIPWLSVNDFAGDSRYVSSTEKHITQAGLDNSSAKLLRKGDIIISARGTVGELAQLSEPMAFNQSCYGIRGISTKIDQAFLYYLLRIVVNDLRKSAHGSVFSTITRNTFESIEVPLPPLTNQNRIAKVLGSLDDKIAVNNRIIETADCLVDALYHQVKKLPPNSTFGEEFEIYGGATPSTKNDEFWGGDIFWATPTDITALNGPWLLNTSRTITHSGLKATSSILHPENAILMTSRATIGKTALASTPITTNQGFIIIHAPKDLVPWLFSQLRNRTHEFESWANGATFLELPRGVFKTLPFIRCDKDQLAKFNTTAWPLLKHIEATQQENQTLARTRDELLPLLMSGKITVRDAEEASAEVGVDKHEVEE